MPFRGRSPPATLDDVDLDRQGLLILDERSCRALLQSNQLGRIALTDRALPLIVPVAFACVGDDLVFRVGPGALGRAADVAQVVCFETDWADIGIGAAWSVSAIGQLSRVTDPDLLDACRRVDLPAWGDSARPAWGDSATPARSDESADYVALRPQMLSGRRRRAA